MTVEQNRPDIETVAREMFPAEYAAITDDNPMDPAKIRAVKDELARRQADHDAGRQVEAVLDVIAPKTDIRAVMAAYGNDGDPDDIEAALGPDIRVPRIMLDYAGTPVMPDDGQLRALAEQIVTAIRTAGGPS